MAKPCGCSLLMVNHVFGAYVTFLIVFSGFTLRTLMAMGKTRFWLVRRINTCMSWMPMARRSGDTFLGILSLASMLLILIMMVWQRSLSVRMIVRIVESTHYVFIPSRG